MIGKLLSACERQQPVAASLVAWSLHSDLRRMLRGTPSNAVHMGFNLYNGFASAYRQTDLPDLIQLTSGGLEELAEQARLLDERLRQWLHEQSVSLHEFETLDELRRSFYNDR